MSDPVGLVRVKAIARVLVGPKNEQRTQLSCGHLSDETGAPLGSEVICQECTDLLATREMPAWAIAVRVWDKAARRVYIDASGRRYREE